MTRSHTNRPHIAVVTGFGDTPMIDIFQEALEKKVNPQSFEMLMNVPNAEAERHPEAFIELLCKKLHNADQEMILIGHSYGAILALTAACRLEFRNVSDLFLIDGPLRSDVEVPPIGAFEMFAPHYEYRTTLAEECEVSLSSLDHPRIIAMGSKVDWIVPYEAKFLKGDQFDWIELPEDTPMSPLESLGSSNILYPLSYTGHRLRKRSVDLVTNIVQWAF